MNGYTGFLFVIWNEVRNISALPQLIIIAPIPVDALKIATRNACSVMTN